MKPIQTSRGAKKYTEVYRPPNILTTENSLNNSFEMLQNSPSKISVESPMKSSRRLGDILQEDQSIGDDITLSNIEQDKLSKYKLIKCDELLQTL